MLREMGRRPTVHLNLPSGLRGRKQRSGRVFYYYDTGAKPRREIPLGSDYALAVKRWAELEIGARERHQEIVTFRYVAERYQRESCRRKRHARNATTCANSRSSTNSSTVRPLRLSRSRHNTSGNILTGASPHPCVQTARRPCSATSSTKPGSGGTSRRRIHAPA